MKVHKTMRVSKETLDTFNAHSKENDQTFTWAIEDSAKRINAINSLSDRVRYSMYSAVTSHNRGLTPEEVRSVIDALGI